MKYGIFSANEWMYPDGDPALGGNSIKVTAAGNSVAAAQILCDGKKVSWQWTACGGTCQKKALKAPQVNQLISVYVDRNTAPVDAGMVVAQGTKVDYVTRLAPFDVFDAMEPMEDGCAEAAKGQMLGLYLRWVTDDMEAGCYGGVLTLIGEDGSEVQIPVEITVSSVCVPAERTLGIINWYNVFNMATYHGVELWSEEHWKLIEEYGKKMQQLRQTHVLISYDIVDCKKEEDGSYTFDFSRAERLIRLYLSLGMKYIEADRAIRRKTWASTQFYISICGVPTPVLSEEGYRFAQTYFTQWREFLQKNGWYEITHQHVCDEPAPHCGDEFRIVSGMVRKWMPGIKIIEAVEYSGLDGAVDIWIPKSLAYVKEKEAFDRKRDLGDEFWYYTCCFPGGEYLNRMLDMDLIRTRYLHWANQLYDFTGYLHWGLNMYEACRGGVWTGSCHPMIDDGGVAPVSESEQNNINNDTLPPGDTHILYPKGKKVLISVRYEMMRKGIEDYELFAMLKEKDSEEAKAILTSCVRSFTDFTTNLDEFEQAYEKLLKKLEA